MLLSIDTDVDSAVGLLDRIHGRLDSPGPMLRLLGEQLDEYETELFATGGRGTWAPDSPATLATKSGGRVLVDTGGLLDALTGRAEQSGESVEVRGTSYAQYVQRGARGAPPRDPVLEPRSSDVEKWAHELLGFITNGRGGGLL